MFANYENMVAGMSSSAFVAMPSDGQERLTCSVNSYTGMHHHYNIYRYVRQTECGYPSEYLQAFTLL